MKFSDVPGWKKTIKIGKFKMKKVKMKTTMGPRKMIVAKKGICIPEEILLIGEQVWGKYQYLL